jgi:hypothetical protein
MRAPSIFIDRFTHANRLALARYGSGNGRSFSPLEKPIAERAVSSKRGLTSLRECLFRCRSVGCNEERQPVQELYFIPKAGRDFGC